MYLSWFEKHSSHAWGAWSTGRGVFFTRKFWFAEGEWDVAIAYHVLEWEKNSNIGWKVTIQNLLWFVSSWWYKRVWWSTWPISARIQEYWRAQRRYSQRQSQLPWWLSTRTWILAVAWWRVWIRHFAWWEAPIRRLLPLPAGPWPGRFWGSEKPKGDLGDKLPRRMWQYTSPTGI